MIISRSITLELGVADTVPPGGGGGGLSSSGKTMLTVVVIFSAAVRENECGVDKFYYTFSDGGQM